MHSDYQVGINDKNQSSVNVSQTDRHSVVSKSSVTHAYMNVERNHGHMQPVLQQPASTQPTRHTGNDRSGEAHLGKHLYQHLMEIEPNGLCSVLFGSCMVPEHTVIKRIRPGHSNSV